ncbi:ExeM/NucH family extracellular endonuclease [Marinobacter sp. VGCF2001]|uniref:ExeM/NucH family extracellular endonuclease n=1 Tax=Marinobacter sp. VGCF2001 TaxID=3417189 RepID=UPI003CF92DC2
MPALPALLCLALLAAGATPMALAGPECGGPATPIHRIQGHTERSPLVGQTVAVEGILTRDARQPGGFSGFYLQQPDPQTDNTPSTSEALFVYTRKTAGRVGERLRVVGTVKEFYGLTELASVRELRVCGRGDLPAPVPVSLPWSLPPESLENMRVRFTGPLTVIDNDNLARYGELVLAGQDQIMATEQLAPGPSARALTQQHMAQRITLDDGLGRKNPEPVAWLRNRNTVRAGDSVTQLEGVLDYRFGQWRLQPTSRPQFQNQNPRPPAPVKAPGTIRIMTLNLQNYFNGDGRGSGFPTARGATSRAGFQAQSRRLITGILAARPDILAVTELENDGYGPDSAAADLARKLGKAWTLVQTPGSNGNDAIRTAVLYRSDAVEPAGAPARLTARGPTPMSRPPLAQAFHANGTSLRFWIVVPHLKSKSCRNAETAEQDTGDGQSCFNRQRTLSAQAITGWLGQLTGQDRTDTPILITGDLNSYAREAPLAHFREAGFISLVHRNHPCRADQCEHYTYRYRGQKGSLDYALGNPSLLPWVQQAVTWNINADEPPALGYRNAPELGGPWRASDHNPVLTDLKLSRGQ